MDDIERLESSLDAAKEKISELEGTVVDYKTNLDDWMKYATELRAALEEIEGTAHRAYLITEPD